MEEGGPTIRALPVHCNAHPSQEGGSSENYQKHCCMQHQLKDLETICSSLT